MSHHVRGPAKGVASNPPCIGRREFVERSIGTMLAAAALGGCASLVTRTVAPVDGALHLALVHYPELTAEAGSLKVIAEGASDPIYVLALGHRRFTALSPICTHLGCTVEIEESRLVCPCHGSNYDREGRVLRGPAEHPLARYPVELTADDVLIITLRPGA
ncbi:MAG TPA: ubiquinol-cytochrome c reductase iron-sulfur subunit [Gemmatimonadaceae bacterium]|nr:ubiquinol-cytochrome c reductase iron-sulfur subunit [Gemmatimonadaceae bacterium]